MAPRRHDGRKRRVGRSSAKAGGGAADAGEGSGDENDGDFGLVVFTVGWIFGCNAPNCRVVECDPRHGGRKSTALTWARMEAKRW